MPLRVRHVSVCVRLPHGLIQGPPLRGAFHYTAARQAITPAADPVRRRRRDQASGSESVKRKRNAEREWPHRRMACLPVGRRTF